MQKHSKDQQQELKKKINSIKNNNKFKKSKQNVKKKKIE